MKTHIRSVFGFFFIALVSAVFAISFAAIIYKGELAAFLDRGIGLTLLGSCVIALVGALTLSYRGSILAPQDVPAILLSSAAATMIAAGDISGEALFATLACLIATASLATGLAGLAFGHFRLAHIARFVPFPVLAGFLAATGLLLLMGGIGVAVGNSADGGGFAAYTAPGTLFKWLPAIIAAITIVFATRVFNSEITLPLALIATAFGFYALMWAFGISMGEAAERSLLLGPFAEGGFVSAIDPSLPGLADWGAIFSQTPVIVTVVATSLIATTLNASGLELALKRDFDISREVKASGIANILGSAVGGIPGYHILGESILANRLGLIGAAAGLSSAVGCAVVLVFGADVLSLLPVGLFGAVLAFLGLDLLYTWLWEERRNLRNLDYGIVALIPVIAVTISFLAAIGVGLLVACAIFMISYAKLDAVRSSNDLSLRRSFVERPDGDLMLLAESGARAKIVELSGFLFFGSSNNLRERLQMIMDEAQSKVEWLVVDFKHVSGMDVSTLRVLQNLCADCEQRDVTLVLCGLAPRTEADLRLATNEQAPVFFSSMDGALEHVEDVLLERRKKAEPSNGADMIKQIEALFGKSGLKGIVERISVERDGRLVESGSRSNTIYLLRSGRLKVVLPRGNGSSAVVAQIRAGAMIGEMAYYSGQLRSADIIADEPCEVLRIDMDRLDRMEKANPKIAGAFHKIVAGNMARRLNRTTKLLRDMDV